MKQPKLEFEVTINVIRRKENELKKEARALAISQGANCLTCKFTKQAVGTKLHCKKKDKYVNQYNYCELWKVDIKESKS